MMQKSILSEYRARKLADEFFEKNTFKKPIEINNKHGKDYASYWAKPELIAEFDREVQDEKLTLSLYMTRLSRDKPQFFSMMFPKGMKLENFLTPCKYGETDHGFRNIRSLLIGGLMFLNLLEMYLITTGPELGAAVLGTPFFVGPFCLILGAFLVMAWINHTNFTFKLNTECLEPELEKGLTHFVIAVDCDVPPHKQLSWLGKNAAELMEKIITPATKVFNNAYLEARRQVNVAHEELDRIYADGVKLSLIEANRVPRNQQGSSIWESKVVMILLCGLLGAVAAVIYLVSRIGG